uniref:B12-binding domain-containing radical SAM protein n=1 Tax=candidate division WOR-3 bacterium TaxID=2052148 RepID=A0A7C6A9B6_UNCW3
MRLDLIVPTWEEKTKRKMKGKAFRLPQLSLGIIGALTPKDVSVYYIDENVEEIDFDDGADLVGITAMTPTAPRAYKIATEFRKRGAKVVLGGIHPSVLPDEALRYCDSVVIGEVETVWQEVIRDFQDNELKPRYQAKTLLPAENIPLPRRELFKNKGYLITSLFQTTRGCPYDCTFCSANLFSGRVFRTRPVELVVKEIEATNAKFVGFLDDNIVGNKKYAKELFQALIPLKIKWLGQASLTLADDDELLVLAEKSGCKGVFIGLESVTAAGLSEVNKRYQRADLMSEKIKKIHDHGILIEGSFIFGLDSDDLGVFERTLEFAKDNKLAVASFGVLTPYPGTPLQKKLQEENRILSYDWRLYTCGRTVFKPKNMTVEQLQEGLDWCWYQFYSYPAIFTRVVKTFPYWLTIGVPLMIINLSYKKMLHRTDDTNELLKNFQFELA